MLHTMSRKPIEHQKGSQLMMKIYQATVVEQINSPPHNVLPMTTRPLSCRCIQKLT
jgi:hypothetical protein